METATAAQQEPYIFGSVSIRRRQQEEIHPRRNCPPSDAKRRSVDLRKPPEMGIELKNGGANGTNGSNECDNGADCMEEDESRSGDSGVGSKKEEVGCEGGDIGGSGGSGGSGSKEDDTAFCCSPQNADHGQCCDVLNGRGGVAWNVCPLCRRIYDEPRVLACLHSFCSPCLRRLLLPQLSAVPCADEEGVEELEMEDVGEEGAEEEETIGSRIQYNGNSADLASEAVSVEMEETPPMRGKIRAPNSESGRSEAAPAAHSAPSRAPSLRSWASFKGAWSPRSRRRAESKSGASSGAAEENSTSGTDAGGGSQKTKENSPRNLHRSLTLVKSSTPPSSPPLQRKQNSFRSGGPSPFAAFPWRKRSSIVSNAANEGVILLLRCPTCGTETEVSTPPGVRRGSCTPAVASSAVSAAVSTLPLHVVLQHRMYLAALNRKAPPAPRPKCDLCSTDATSGCTECALTLCALCAETHRRQRSTSSHSLVLLSLDHTVTNRVSRVSMCPLHPSNAQRLFCGPCGRLACRACPCATSSGNHRCEPVAHAARNWAAPAVRTALEKARPYAENACASVHGLRHIEQRVQMRTAQVEEEVDCFVDSWIRSLEEHRRVLHAEARRARDSKLEALRSRRMGLERRAESVSVAVRFADELLTEATDAELLGLAGPLIRRLEWCRASAEAAGSGGRGASRSPFPASPGEQASAMSLQFLPAERAGSINGHEMYGVVTAQTVCPARCRIFAEGLANCRQHRKTEVVVVTRDSEDQPIGHGGEQVVAELRYRDASHRQLPVHVSDQKDGSYILTFIPDAAGALSLSVTVQGKPIQGSPFTVHARTIRAHTGIFHCCSFCSSHGNKEATCACGGKMPGGYKGCGHGHTGHPGRRHWSCCGNVLEGSECGRANGVFTYTI